MATCNWLLAKPAPIIIYVDRSIFASSQMPAAKMKIV
jgi:hypothetical protein